MRYSEIVSMVNEIGIPFAYDHFAEGDNQDPPFIVFRIPESDNFGADDVVYKEIVGLDIELYTDTKRPDLEKAVKDVLNGHEIFFQVSDAVWIASEKMYVTPFEMEVFYEQ